MPIETAERLLSVFSLQAIARETWFVYAPAWAVVVAWLAIRIWQLGRAQKLASRFEAARRVQDHDLLTLPCLFVCLMSLAQVHVFFENLAHLSEAGVPVAAWLIFTSAGAGLLGVVALSTVATLVARHVLGLNVPSWPRLGLPGVFAIASLLALWLIVLATIYAWWLYGQVGDGTG